jgi:hypothetical protein
VLSLTNAVDGICLLEVIVAELKEVKEVKDAPRVGTSARSGIASPYFDLGASIAVAEAIYKQGGGACSPDQLALWLGYKSTGSGTYMTRLAAANKHFGTVEVNGERIAITERAKKILTPVMPEDAIGARVEAFLAVPLFSRVYEQYKGSQLPPEVGLKNLFLNTYQILPERVAQAVRVFLNSADQAGFFSATSGDRSRLIKPSQLMASPAVLQPVTPQPAVESLKPTDSPPPPSSYERAKGGGGSDGAGSVHSAIIGLLRDLPQPGTDWPKKNKARFLKAFQATLDHVYPSDDEDDYNVGGKE